MFSTSLSLDAWSFYFTPAHTLTHKLFFITLLKVILFLVQLQNEPFCFQFILKTLSLSPTPRDECQFKHKHGFLLQKIPIICSFKNQLKLQHCSDAENICQSSVEIAYLYFPVYSLKIMFATLIWWNYSFQSPAGLTAFSNRKLCVNK